MQNYIAHSLGLNVKNDDLICYFLYFKRLCNLSLTNIVTIFSLLNYFYSLICLFLENFKQKCMSCLPKICWRQDLVVNLFLAYCILDYGFFALSFYLTSFLWFFLYLVYCFRDGSLIYGFIFLVFFLFPFSFLHMVSMRL